MRSNVEAVPLGTADKRWLWYVILAGILTLSGAAFAADDVYVPAGNQVTLHGRFTLDDLTRDGYNLAGLASTPGGAPDVVALTWAEVPAGWFGSVWGVQLTSKAEIVPAHLAQHADGFLTGTPYINLINYIPDPGHTYELTLAFDPQTGTAGVALFDLTADELVVERGLRLNAFEEDYVPTFGFDTGSDVSWHQTEVLDRFQPSGLSWRLVQPDAQGVRVPVDAVDRQDNAYVRVSMPWETLPGTLDIWLDDGTERVRTASTSEVHNGIEVPLPLAERPSGEYVLNVEYVTGDNRSDLGSRPFRIGKVHARLANPEVTVVGPRSIAVRGDLVVSSDGPVDKATVELNLALERLVLTSNQANQRIFSTHRDLSHSVLLESLRDLTPEPIVIPFETTVEVVSDVEWPYRIWRVELAPTVETTAGFNVTPHTEDVRIYAEEPRPSGGPFRVMTYNIHHGAGMDDEIDLQRLADVIAYSGADVIGLQEVDVRTRRSLGIDQVSELGELLMMETVFAGNLLFQGGQFGNAVLSRYPIVSSQNVRLPLLRGETRGLLHTVIDVDGKRLSFYVTHLSLYEDENEVQREAVVRRLASDDRPFMLVGDFNVSPPFGADSREILDPIVRDAWLEATQRSSLRTMTSSGYTFNSANPTRRIDYIFLSDQLDIVGDEGVFVIRSTASDHLPVVAELQLKD